MEDRMCGTLDDVTVGTEIDLDRDIPEIGIKEILDRLLDIECQLDDSLQPT